MSEDALSPWNSFFLAPKPQAKPGMPASKQWKLVEDFRKLNEVVEADNNPMPVIQELLKAQWSSKFILLHSRLPLGLSSFTASS